MVKHSAQESSSLPVVLAETNRKLGAGTIGVSDTMTALPINRIGTGLPKLDIALGGGFPCGQITELYGPPSSGKSLISLLTIKEAQSQGKECIYFDIENSYDPEWAQKMGVDTGKLIVTQMSIGEDIVDLICQLLDTKPGVIVADSVAAIITRSEIEENADQKFVAPLARLLSYGLTRITSHNKETVIIFINQIRQAISAFGPGAIYTPGGKKLPHMASIRAEIKKDPQLITESGAKSDKDIIGQVVNYKITKNKTAPPYKYGSFSLYYDGRVEEQKEG